jgi:transposase
MAAERVGLRRRHIAELKALVLEQCAAPGASVAKVAMSHGVNANIAHGWRKLAREREGAAMSPPGPHDLAGQDGRERAAVLAGVHGADNFAASARGQSDRAASRRGRHEDRAATMKVTWPTAAAAECAAWMRELFIESQR